MEQRIEMLQELRLTGVFEAMSLHNNTTGRLWNRFMKSRHLLTNTISEELYSIQILPENYYRNFDPAVPFIKWAAAPVADFKSVPASMDQLIIPQGLYAVFLHKGPASEGVRSFTYIFNQWMHDSDYEYAERPQFEVLGGKYKNEDPASEEEIWIPVKLKDK